MITKKEFKEFMKDFLEIKEDENNLNKAFKKFEPDFNYISFGRYESLVLNILETSLDDYDKWLSYWIYECDCGKDIKKKVTDAEGKKRPIKTLDNLYDLIIKDSKKYA